MILRRTNDREAGKRWVGADRPGLPELPWLLSAVLAAVLLAAVLILGMRDGADDGSGTGGTIAPAGGADSEEDREEAGEPTLVIQPQRAQAGSPLELSARGTGCGGRSAMLSIVALGTPSDTGGFDRLVVRRRVDVASDGTWSTAPLLVGQPVGSYRVTARCDRRAVLDGAEVPDERRDVFVAAEHLELTGPARRHEFDVAPATAPPGQALTVRLTGRGDCPAGARVSGSVFPAADAVGPARPFEAVVDASGRWQASVAIAARDAGGSYGVEARCSSGLVYVTNSVRFLVPDDGPPAAVPVGPDAGTRAPAPATPVPGRPTYTG